VTRDRLGTTFLQAVQAISRISEEYLTLFDLMAHVFSDEKGDY